MHASVLFVAAWLVPSAFSSFLGRRAEPFSANHDTLLAARAGPAADVTVDLTAAFNNPLILADIDNDLPSGVKRTNGVEVSWQTWKSLSGTVKGRAKLTHQDADPVVRVALPINVNKCLGVDGHIVYYVFPDNLGFAFNATVDSWDTLTDNNDLCQSEVNDALKQQVPTHIPFINSLVATELAALPNEHFPSFLLFPAGGGGYPSQDVELVLERSSIESRWSNMCMHVKGNSLAAGAVVEQWPCQDANSQRWDKVAQPEGFFLLQNRNSGKFLAVTGSSSDAGAVLGQWDLVSADPSFQWYTVDPGTGNTVGALWLVNKRSGKCVEDTAWATTSGTVLTQQNCVGGWLQYWYGV